MVAGPDGGVADSCRSSVHCRSRVKYSIPYLTDVCPPRVPRRATPVSMAHCSAPLPGVAACVVRSVPTS